MEGLVWGNPGVPVLLQWLWARTYRGGALGKNKILLKIFW